MEAKAYFSSLVMTFPPGFAFDATAMRELWRVLEPRGILIWRDDSYLYSRDIWSRILNVGVNLTGVGAKTRVNQVMRALRGVNGGSLIKLWDWRVKRVECARSHVHVFLATKRG